MDHGMGTFIIAVCKRGGHGMGSKPHWERDMQARDESPDEAPISLVHPVLRLLCMIATTRLLFEVLCTRER
jgi:hypothetical protein